MYNIVIISADKKYVDNIAFELIKISSNLNIVQRFNFDQLKNDLKVVDIHLIIVESDHPSKNLFENVEFVRNINELIPVILVYSTLDVYSKLDLVLNYGISDCINKASVSELLLSVIRELKYHQTKKELVETQKLSSLAIEGAQVGLWELNLKTFHTDYNTTYYSMLGYDSTDVIHSKKFHDTIIHPEDDQIIESHMDEILKGKRTEFEEVIRLKTKQGYYNWILDRAKIVEYDINGNPLKLAGTHVDITDQIDAEILLTETNLKMRSLIEASPVAIYQISPDGMVEDFWNKAAEEIFGYNQSEIIGKKLPHMKGKFLEEFESIIEKVKLGEQFLKKRLKRVKKDGTPMDIEISIGPIFDENGKLLKLLIITSEITELVEKEEQIAHSLIEKEVMLKEIHHRIKNNLALVSSILYLQQKKQQSNMVIEAFKIAQSRIQSIASVHELIYQNESFSNINVQNYLDKILKNILEIYSTKNLDIHFDMDIDKIYLTVERAIPLAMIFHEAITNIFKHAYDDLDTGRTVISLKKNQHHHILEITDDGNGFPEDFNMELESTLGMILIKQFTSQLEGELCIKRNAVRGVQFRLTF